MVLRWILDSFSLPAGVRKVTSKRRAGRFKQRHRSEGLENSRASQPDRWRKQELRKQLQGWGMESSPLD
ncbi:hypothetical protein APTSU1_000885400 [Apodemus speciosus]|uniref:Uncharacterized protein n=1 Tax=Apodemus speciosus TaxID=105296 RepID=A0ABQ0F2W0_APOSI